MDIIYVLEYIISLEKYNKEYNKFIFVYLQK